MTDWALVGGDPALGHPEAFRSLADRLGSAAEAASCAVRQVERVGANLDGAVWRGESAEAFAAKLGELPGQLAKMHDSYSSASGALAAYGRLLQSLQERARIAVARAVSARSEADAIEPRRRLSPPTRLGTSRRLTRLRTRLAAG